MKVIDKSVWEFSKDNAPIAQIESGEILLFRSRDCFNGQIQREDQLVHDLDLTKANPAAGPVEILGAKPGDVLAVDILDILVDQVGFACSMKGIGPLSHKSEVRTRVIPVEDGVVSFNDIKWLAEPMVGVIGTAPKEDSVACGYSGDHGGNLDSKHIKKGARVYFPVRVDGGLLQMGDLHASMGDGELCGTGVEISGDILVRVSLIKDVELNWPLTETDSFWYVNTTGSSYEEALVPAAEEIGRLACKAYGWDMTDFFIYLSLQGETALNQGVYPSSHPMHSLRVGIPKLADKNRLI